MIPLKLTLHNFMSYRDPDPLDFSGLHLACLSGNNGHGKSALLDAITWALWGRARSNQADELIHLGQSDMSVDFEFALGEQRYRVIRSRERKGRSGKSDLQLQVSQAEGEWRPITEPTVRDTEQAIINLLRMDYDTFINSAFLMQGRADEFTVKPANQRKQILANILGLGVYDDYEARAKERAREHKQEAVRLSAQLQAIDDELARTDSYQQELEQAQQQLDAWSSQLRQAEQAEQAARAERQELQAQRRMADDLHTRLEQLKRQLAAGEAQLQQDLSRLAADESLLTQQAAIGQGYRAWQAARQADQTLNQQLSQQVTWQAEQNRLESRIRQARFEWETQQRSLEEQQQRLQATAAQADEAGQQLQQARGELMRLAQLEAQQGELRRTIHQLTEERAGLEAHNKTLQAEMKTLREKMTSLESVEALCPVCRQPLGDAERSRVLAEYQRDGETRGDRFRLNQARISEIAIAGKAAEAQLAEADSALRARSRWQRDEARAEQQAAQAATAAAELAPLQNRAAQVAAQLANEDYAHETTAALHQLSAQLAELAYDSAAHEEVRRQARELESFDERHTQMQMALSRTEDLQARITHARALHQQLQQSQNADQSRHSELLTAVARLPQVEAHLAQCSREVQHLARTANDARQRLGAARQRLDACRAQAERRLVLAAELDSVARQQSLYEELQAAFGKKGLQAMIIEAAIPELEAEANQLLTRMTDGRMTVRLETQRETKTTQELRETLEIILSDELGSRDYSLFSGGEAFRANLAIRIALSKLLARRSGAALQTLIVDEGFGTQDVQGRERLVQAITSIQHDFERVLVITHIDELKDLFPARIEVVKTEQGSQISVN